jgi:glutathione synthase/RimK-type ligase-like ATP-grasp enzyme
MPDSPPLLHDLLVMTGIPDDRRVVLTSYGPDGQATWSVPGNSSFASQLAPALRQRLRNVYFGPLLQLGLRPEAAGRPLVNNISDPDTSAIALGMLVELVAKMRAPCFNHPAAVLDSSRERVAAKLAAIAGMHVPRTVRARIDEPADLGDVADAQGLAFPLIVRPAGAHGGEGTAKVDSAADARVALRGVPWGGRDLFLTEYVDYRDDDGQFRKVRLVFAGGEVLLRHQVVASDWHVHVRDRSAAALAEEAAMLEGFATTQLPRLRPTLDDVAAAMDLDFFGMDCSLRPDGRVLLFEANAAMNILHNTQPSPNIWDAPIRRIHDALAAVLFDPSRWRRRAAVTA